MQHAKTSAFRRHLMTAFSLAALSTSVSLLLLLHRYIPERPDLALLSRLAQRESRCGDGNATSRLREMVEFLPLRDAGANAGRARFMSSLEDSMAPDVAEHLLFPSAASRGRLLCLAGGSRSDGARNSYAVAWRDALPRGAELLAGLTFVVETFYDYENLYHGLSTIVPFVGWHKWRACVRPTRWVLFHRGEVRTQMGMWVRTLAEAAMEKEVVVETMEHGERAATCFEEAVVFRHNEGSMALAKRQEIYDMMRCKARRYCNATGDGGGDEGAVVRMTLLLRRGPRSFADEPAAVSVFEEECAKVSGCSVRLVRPDNLTFCDQVRLMRNTDLLISQHGAQVTNMIFMDQNSSVMEFFPGGWKELAGSGKNVFLWIAQLSGMRYQGAYMDSLSDDDDDSSRPGGTRCPFPRMDIRCFSAYYKNLKIKVNESYFAEWTGRVLREIKDYKASRREANAEETIAGGSSDCACGS